MPVFDVRLEAQDGSGHYRHSAIQAADADEARATLEGREREYEMYRLDTAEIGELEREHGSDVIAEALEAPKEAKMPAGLPANVRAKLAIHRQSKPYKIVSVKERVS